MDVNDSGDLFNEDEISNFFAQFEMDGDEDDEFNIDNPSPQKSQNVDEPYNFSKKELKEEVEELKEEKEEHIYREFLAGTMDDSLLLGDFETDVPEKKRKKNRNSISGNDFSSFHSLEDSDEDFDFEMVLDDSDLNIGFKELFPEDEEQIEPDEILSLIEDTSSNFVLDVKENSPYHGRMIMPPQNNTTANLNNDVEGVRMVQQEEIDPKLIHRLKDQVRQLVQMNIFLYLQCKYHKLSIHYSNQMKADMASIQSETEKNEKVIKSNLVFFTHTNEIITRSKINECKSVMREALEMNPKTEFETIEIQTNNGVQERKRKRIVIPTAFEKLEEFFAAVEKLSKRDFENGGGKVKAMLIQIFGLYKDNSKSHIPKNSVFGIDFSNNPMSMFKVKRGMGRTRFTNTEDELLIRGLNEFGKKWELIRAKFLPSKTAKQCQIRFKNMVSKKNGNIIRKWKLAQDEKKRLGKVVNVRGVGKNQQKQSKRDFYNHDELNEIRQNIVKKVDEKFRKNERNMVNNEVPDLVPIVPRQKVQMYNNFREKKGKKKPEPPFEIGFHTIQKHLSTKGKGILIPPLPPLSPPKTLSNFSIGNKSSPNVPLIDELNNGMTFQDDNTSSEMGSSGSNNDHTFSGRKTPKKKFVPFGEEKRKPLEQNPDGPIGFLNLIRSSERDLHPDVIRPLYYSPEQLKEKINQRKKPKHQRIEPIRKINQPLQPKKSKNLIMKKVNGPVIPKNINIKREFNIGAFNNPNFSSINERMKQQRQMYPYRNGIDKKFLVPRLQNPNHINPIQLHRNIHGFATRPMIRPTVPYESSFLKKQQEMLIRAQNIEFANEKRYKRDRERKRTILLKRKRERMQNGQIDMAELNRIKKKQKVEEEKERKNLHYRSYGLPPLVNITALPKFPLNVRELMSSLQRQGKDVTEVIQKKKDEIMAQQQQKNFFQMQQQSMQLQLHQIKQLQQLQQQQQQQQQQQHQHQHQQHHQQQQQQQQQIQIQQKRKKKTDFLPSPMVRRALQIQKNQKSLLQKTNDGSDGLVKIYPKIVPKKIPQQQPPIQIQIPIQMRMRMGMGMGGGGRRTTPMRIQTVQHGNVKKVPNVNLKQNYILGMGRNMNMKIPSSLSLSRSHTHLNNIHHRNVNGNDNDNGNGNGNAKGNKNGNQVALQRISSLIPRFKVNNKANMNMNMKIMRNNIRKHVKINTNPRRGIVIGNPNGNLNRNGSGNINAINEMINKNKIKNKIKNNVQNVNVNMNNNMGSSRNVNVNKIVPLEQRNHIQENNNEESTPSTPVRIPPLQMNMDSNSNIPFDSNPEFTNPFNTNQSFDMGQSNLFHSNEFFSNNFMSSHLYDSRSNVALSQLDTSNVLSVLGQNVNLPSKSEIIEVKENNEDINWETFDMDPFQENDDDKKDTDEKEEVIQNNDSLVV